MAEVRHLDWGKCDWFNPKPTVKEKYIREAVITLSAWA